MTTSFLFHSVLIPMHHIGITQSKFLFGWIFLMCLSLSGQAQTIAYTGNKSNPSEEESPLHSPAHQARQKLGLFLESFKQNQSNPAYSFSVLVHFPKTAERTWIVVRDVDYDTYTGYLSDVYENSTNLTAEQLLRFNQEQIEDWRIVDSEKEITVGNFVLTAQLEKALQDRQSLRLNREQVPAALRSLIPQAEFWGIQDDLVRASRLATASLQQKDELLGHVGTKESAIQEWLVEYKSKFTHSAEEESFYYLLVANKEIRDKTRE